MRKVSLGIIGLGYIGMIHFRHSQRLPNAKLDAVSDLSKSALKRARKANVEAYTDYDKLLANPAIDAVIISLPTHLHLECVQRAAEAKKHIFLEKPIARKPSEAKEIISVARKNGVKLMMGYHLRFDEAFRNTRSKIRLGLLGDVESAYATFIGSGPFFHRDVDNAPVPVPEWWFNKELTGGGVLTDLGCHMINLLRWLFGDIRDIKSHLKYRFNMDFEDSALCMAKFESGVVGLINVGWFSQEFSLKVDVLGSVKHDFPHHMPASPQATMIQTLATGIPKFYHAHYAELQYFAGCLLEDKTPSLSTGEDGLKDIEAISQAYQNQIYLG